jgi:glycerol-3-phosphate acyltransferase PlsY
VFFALFAAKSPHSKLLTRKAIELMVDAFAILAAYLLGSIPVGFLLVKWRYGADVRTTGSGGTGATNVLRRAGKGIAILTLLLDIGKGFAAVILARYLTSSSGTNWVVALSAVAAIVGHIFPVWLGFRAGKGVATGLGAFLAIAPVAAGVSLVVFLLTVAITRYASLGSILASVTTPLWAWLLYGARSDFPPMLVALCCGALLIIGKHTSNIQRLLKGNESKLGARTGAAT